MIETLSIHQIRQKKLIESIQTSGLDGMVINPGPSLYYLTGLNFHLSERPVVLIFPVQGDLAIILPKLESGKLEDATYAIKGFTYSEDPAQWVQAFNRALKYTNLENATVGLEPRALRVLELNLLKKSAPQANFVPAEKTISALRRIKDEKEINFIRRAVKIAQDALRATIPKIQIGATEREIASELTMQLLTYGSNPHLPFFPIVSSGPNSANPHAAPSDRKISSGDLVVIDYGANVENYFSDITRTFAIGKIDPEFQKIAEIVHSANKSGFAAARQGVPISDIDQAARQVIIEAGYGEYFVHRTGHGLGLEGHEEPYIRGDNQNLLEIGMSFTIEPGIYLPNRGGVRIEDNVILTEQGCESLTDLPRELIRIA